MFFIVCDGSKGLPDSLNAVFPAAIVQTYIVHMFLAGHSHASIRFKEVLGIDPHGSAQDISTRDRRRGMGGVRGVRGEMGQGLGGHPVALAGRVGAFIPFLAHDLRICKVLSSPTQSRT